MSVAHVMAYFMFLLNNNGLDNAMKEKFNSIHTGYKTTATT